MRDPRTTWLGTRAACSMALGGSERRSRSQLRAVTGGVLRRRRPAPISMPITALSLWAALLLELCSWLMIQSLYLIAC
jgi:hypothetical protein